MVELLRVPSPFLSSSLSLPPARARLRASEQRPPHDSSAPQKGRCEREGGWVKTRLQGKLRAGDTVVIMVEHLDEILHWVVAYKNRFLQWGGYFLSGSESSTAAQAPRRRGQDTLGLQALDDDPRLQDAISREQFQGRGVRMIARTLALVTDAQARVQVAQRSGTHRDRVFFQVNES